MVRVAVAGLFLLAAGCSNSDPGRYIPPEDKARQALDAALTGWRNGSPGGAVPGTADPVVQFVDSHRGPGQRLKDYTVLGMAPGDGPRVFTVRLTLDGPAADVKVRYVVFGIDPVWVIRHEDFDMINHWDHPMKAKDERGSSPGR
ncbi:MAG TPA: hypothetical protein VKE40_20450 [Gemmataceae bacterium]|nr:hypothetical protein [Gemmataceae bacterium]